MPGWRLALLFILLAVAAGAVAAVLRLLRRTGAPSGATPRSARASLPAASAEPAPDAQLATLGHELRSPLNSVIALTQLMADGRAGPLNAEQRRYLEIIERNGQALLRRINDFLDLRSMANVGGRMGLDLAAVPAEPVTRPARAPDRALREPTPGPALGGRRILVIEDDAAQRQQVVELIASAGMDASAAGSGREGLDELRRSPVDAVVLDLVMPDKTGLDVLAEIDADDRLRRIPVVVLSAMYITKSEQEILGRHVTEVVQKGEAMGLRLVAALHRALARSAARGRPVPEDRPSILLVEDDADSVFALREVLAALPVDVVTAATAAQAVASCRAHPPDLILMDVELPDLSGLEASAAIRRLPGCEGTRVVALTAQASAGDRERILAAGCDEYLAKPVQPRDVVSLVTRALDLEPRPVTFTPAPTRH